MTLEQIEKIFQAAFYMNDISPLRVLFAVAAGAILNVGPPLWLLIIGAPATLKTELLEALRLLPVAFFLSDLTPRTFASGYQNPNATSLLPKIDKKMLVIKDFGTILSLNANARNEILAQLRDIYDGHLSKIWGTGDRFEWTGKIYLLAACTPMIYQHTDAISQLGERFVYFRMDQGDRQAAARKAIENIKNDSILRTELSVNVKTFFSSLDFTNTNVTIPTEQEVKLMALADFATRFRSPVIRDRCRREIQLVPEPEGPGRMIKTLTTIWESLAILVGAAHVRDEDFPIIIKLALDSAHPERIRLLESLYPAGAKSIQQLEIELQRSQSSIRRMCEDLEALQILRNPSTGQGVRRVWELTPEMVNFLNIFLGNVQAGWVANLKVMQ